MELVPKILLNNIKYHKPSDLSELNRFLHIMSIEDTNDIYDNTNHALSSFQREFSSMRDEIQRISQKYEQTVNEMNTRQENLDKIIQELKSEINSAKATIGEQNNKIRENESTIAKNLRDLQTKDATINEKVKKIKDLTGEGGYPFKSDLFSGIIDGLSKKLGRNLADSSDVDVTASSISGSSNVPMNVLKNDNSNWCSKDLPNSWIQFDFKQRKVSLTSYSMNTRCGVKSWKVEGSTDGSTFEIIDKKIDTTDFQNSNGNFNDPSAQKNFPVQPNNKYYRYIRITSTSKRWHNDDFFSIFRVDFFGFVQYE